MWESEEETGRERGRSEMRDDVKDFPACENTHPHFKGWTGGT